MHLAKIIPCLLVISCFTLSGCSSTDGSISDRAVIGGAIGLGVGAAFGSVGGALAGGAVGAAIGAVSGPMDSQ
jgi:predicted small secreted protein